MRWFRSNVRSGAWFALIAMALQLALTFGHLHLRGTSAAQLAASATITLPDGSSLPTKPRLVDENCAVCTLIQMAGAAALVAAVWLLLPGLFASTRFAIRIEHRLAASPPLHFQARGPPIA
jgi:hypothetical protein